MKNKGFTLIEVLVVLAVLGVCVTIMSPSISLTSRFEARKCAEKIDMLLSKCKMNVMSKEENAFLRLYTKGGITKAEYCENGEVVSSEELGSSRCKVSYVVDGGTTALGSTGLIITFQRETGVFDFTKNGWGESEKCTSIIVNGGRREYKITLIPATGAHTLEVGL